MVDFRADGPTRGLLDPPRAADGTVVHPTRPQRKAFSSTLRLSEGAFESHIVERATAAGWHCHGARLAPQGFPDLLLVKDERCIVAELKRNDGCVSAAQAIWLEVLRRVTRMDVAVWRPEDWLTVTDALVRGGKVTE